MRTTLVLLLLAAAPFLQAQTADSARVSVIETSGTAKRTVAPRLATISIQYSAVGRTVAEAGARLAMKTDSIRGALWSVGIPRDSIPNGRQGYWWGGRVQQVVGPQICIDRPHAPTQPASCDWRTDTTYKANDALEIRVHDLSRLGAVMDTLMGRGITDISPVSFAPGDLSASRMDALHDATVDARAQAEAVASAGGVALGRVLSFSTREPESTWSGSVVAGAIEPRNAGTVIVRPSITLEVTVYAKWELVQKTK